MRALGEASVCFSNFQKFLQLPEFELVTEQDLECDHEAVVAIKDANFAWEVENMPNQNSKESASTTPKKNDKRTVKKPKNKKSKPNGKGVVTPPISTVGNELNPEEQILTNGIKDEESPILLQSCLSNLNLQIKRGSLLGVSGSVGSGKSALISSILGETVKTSGKMLIRGSLAVVPQQAWIYSDSLQENILFGSPMNKEK